MVSEVLAYLDLGVNIQTYFFSLVLSNVTIDTSDLEDKLFEAGCDDGLICFYGPNVYIEFDREGESFQSAIISAINNIESAGLNAKVKSVDAGFYVGLSDIAELTDISKQSIAMLKDGKRGPGTFPTPILRLTSKQPLWRWGEVANWLSQNNKIPQALSENAKTVEMINLALELRPQQKLDEILTLTHALNEQA